MAQHRFPAALIFEDGALKLANLVTLSRAVLIAPIIWLLMNGLQTPALGLYVLAALTDVFDGWIARNTGRASRYGAQLDAAVDNIFSLGILVFLTLAWPEMVQRQIVAVVILFGGPLVYLVVSWAMRRKLMMFHFWSAKLGAFLLFCLWPLLAFSGAENLITIIALVVGFSRVEQTVYMLRGGGDLNAPHGFGPVSPAQSA